MRGLGLKLTSFTDMTMERAMTIARAFDAHPMLRPLKVGGDPARIKVDPSMEAVFANQGLPIELLTVRKNGRYPDVEFGDIRLLPGRGGWIGQQRDGEWEYSLTGNRISQAWLAATLSEPGAIVEVKALFEDLVVAADAAFAYATSEPGWNDGTPTGRLHGVSWLNYFGPAFLSLRPGLADIAGARLLSSGGMLIRTNVDPELESSEETHNSAIQLREVLGERAFEFGNPNSALPTAFDHVLASPGTLEMPWVVWQRQKSVDARPKKYASARRRLTKALAARADPQLATDVVEWSASFGLDEWQEFAEILTRRLGGEFSSAVGRAALAVIQQAPLDEEDSVRLATKLGVVQVGWFIDDIDVMDAYIFGSQTVFELCDSLYVERMSDE